MRWWLEEDNRGMRDTRNKVAAEGGPAGTSCNLLGHLHEGSEGPSRVVDW